MKRLLLSFILFVLLVFATGAAGQAAELIDKMAVNDKWIALTIEDIETPADMRQVLKLCEQWNAKVTFFIAASVLEQNQDIVKLAVAGGHEFGNHGVSHRYWGGINQTEIKQELVAADNILRKVTGRGTEVFKPPYNYYEESYLDAVQQIAPKGLIVRGADLTDWTLMTKESVIDKAKTSAASGGIIHLNYKVKQAAAALPDILEQLKKMGYSLGTISELKTKAAPSPQPKLQPLAKPPVKPGYYGVVHHVNVSQPAVALTFDDGGSPYRVNAILDILKSYQAKATFFLLGNWVNNNPELVRRMMAEGHEVANHSYSHSRFTWLNEAEIRSEIEITQTAIAEATGQPAAAFFRPPYGSYNSKVVSIVRDMGYEAIVMWDIDTRDWSGASAAAISGQVLDNVSPGSIVLFHLHGANTAEALEEIIPALQGQGYQLRTVGQMLAS